MGLWRIHNTLCVSDDVSGHMPVDLLMKDGVQSVLDLRLLLPPDHLKTERQELAMANIGFQGVPLDVNIAWPVNAIDQGAAYVAHQLPERKVCLHENVDQGVANLLAAAVLVRSGWSPKQAVEFLTTAGRTVALSNEQKAFLNAYAETLSQQRFYPEMPMDQMYTQMQEHMDANLKREKSNARLFTFVSLKTKP